MAERSLLDQMDVGSNPGGGSLKDFGAGCAQASKLVSVKHTVSNGDPVSPVGNHALFSTKGLLLESVQSVARWWVADLLNKSVKGQNHLLN